MLQFSLTGLILLFHFYTEGEQSILCLGPLSQGTEGQAVKVSRLAPNPATSSAHQGSSLHQSGADGPLPMSTGHGQQLLPRTMKSSVVWTFSCPPHSRCLSQLQVERGSAGSTGATRCRAGLCTSHLATASSSESKGGTAGWRGNRDLYVHCSHADLTAACTCTF